MTNTKAGYATIIGNPNAGKSTLLNGLLGTKLSIITNKPQTTRKRVLGIYNDDVHQIIFLDTPGILAPEYLLQQKMMEYVEVSIDDADVLLFLLDIHEDPNGSKLLEQEVVQKALNKPAKKALLLNKIDKATPERVKELITLFSEKYNFETIIPLSALKNFNLEAVLNFTKENIPEGPKFYPDDQLSDATERFFVSEIIREKIFEQFREEIPYSTEVVIEEFREQKKKKKDFISASIIVERDSQKPIILGKKGEAIKKIGQTSREAIEEFLDRGVYLELFVKVKSKWRSDQNQLKNFGYLTGNE